MNTSGEESKYGIEPDQAGVLARHVREGCAHLRLAGLMTIGQPDYSSRPENFQVGLGSGFVRRIYRGLPVAHGPGTSRGPGP